MHKLNSVDIYIQSENEFINHKCSNLNNMIDVMNYFDTKYPSTLYHILDLHFDNGWNALDLLFEHIKYGDTKFHSKLYKCLSHTRFRDGLDDIFKDPVYFIIKTGIF